MFHNSEAIKHNLHILRKTGFCNVMKGLLHASHGWILWSLMWGEEWRPQMLGLLYEVTPPTQSSLTVFSQNFKDQSNEQQHANGLIVSLTLSSPKKFKSNKLLAFFCFLSQFSLLKIGINSTSLVHAVLIWRLLCLLFFWLHLRFSWFSVEFS